MSVDLTTTLDCSFEQAVAHVMTPRLLSYVAHPWIAFVPASGTSFPARWHEGTHWVHLRLLGVLPLGRQAIVISLPQRSEGFALRDNGHSALIRQWDHLIEITPLDAQRVRYRDRVEVRAGWLTPLVRLFAQGFYRHRQRRWKKLVAKGFDYGAA